MAKYLVKANWNSGQLRITIPKSLVEELGWGDVEYVMLEEYQRGSVEMMRFIDGKSLKSEAAGSKTGSD